MAGNSGGPWGGGGNDNGDNGRDQRPNGGRRPPSEEPSPIPEIDELSSQSSFSLANVTAPALAIRASTLRHGLL